MAKYDVFAGTQPGTLLLDVQSDLLGGLNTRVVVPLIPQGQAPVPARFLNPVVEIDGVPHVMVTQFLAAVPAGMLRDPVDSLAARADEVTRALDMLFQGF
ncbi:toxin CcdB [Cribrihabitans marinus]|uniref:Toxin CcdB n=1 Tax=Cribrihabitans marinus TaxID=1227549 RepID=A0A1H7DLY5_9RHOB|nr:CcdB family protein [Cribrihabitans marinus]SEK02598.1 toxin CcdB [Cribrihabitans marinus]